MKKLKLISKKEINNELKVYDIEVADEHHYILENGILSHNSIGSFFPHDEISGGGGIKYNASIIFMLTKSKLEDKDSSEHVKNKGLDPHTKIGIVVTVTPSKQRFARPIKVQIHIPFYKKPNAFVGLEKFVSWENCGILRGKAFSKKEYDKMTAKDQELCHEFEVKLDANGKKVDQITKMYAYPKETSRSLVCRHLGGEVPIGDLYTEKVFSESVLRELDEKIIKPTFMLPSIESLEDLAEVTSELENAVIDGFDTDLPPGNSIDYETSSPTGPDFD
jgi:hypothetical protein